MCVPAGGHSSPLGLQRRQPASPAAPPGPGCQADLQRQGGHSLDHQVPKTWCSRLCVFSADSSRKDSGLSLGDCLCGDGPPSAPPSGGAVKEKKAQFRHVRCFLHNLLIWRSPVLLSCTALLSMSPCGPDTATAQSISSTAAQTSTPRTE